ncbi:hypothetical protein NFIA_054050 [Paecilomyces variotii No. 5]|uniref:RED-like N-terminal domain-containing protein n=1 Tax=Byssochlamys spectabilis (strain No. 5 / NBRC 109023) TaxID=1356009 RepID=V5FV96_BYSSN|nr:hypothetical protein NFIA_054050 [Paecilomyces variotii No. 5]
MNNEQFRRLILEQTPVRDKDKSPNGSSPPQKGSAVGGATPGVLGSRMRSSIPMTPRSVTGVDFARQLAEHRRELQQPPTKRFKSSAAPKGTKLASGYQDRSLLRRKQDEEEAEAEDKEKRVKALKELVKLGQIDQATFEKLRAEIGVGGDVSSTHLVKGLDWNLLKRVKAGEDVTKAQEEETPEAEAPEAAEDVDDEFDRVLDEKEKDVRPVAPKEEKVKKGNMAAPPPPPPAASSGQKRSRDEILKQLKASRTAAAAGSAPSAPEQTGPALGSKFKKIGDNKQRWIEQDENGRRREILITKDAEGRTKKKVRYLDKPGEQNGGLLAPDKSAKPLGMEVPAEIAAKIAAAPEEEEDGDIFEGIGADYNPLGDLDDEDSSSESEDETAAVKKDVVSSKSPPPPETAPTEAAEKAAEAPAKPRNYFSTSITAEAEESSRANPFATDPTIMAALKRAAQLRQAESAEAAGEEDADVEALARRKKFLEEAKRREAQDAMDMDYGFGSSRIEDEEDEEGPTWEERGGNKRKRGPKKRKGNKDSAADVLRVLDARGKGDKGKT